MIKTQEHARSKTRFNTHDCACSWVLIVGIACTIKTHDQNLGACTNRSPLQDLPQLNRGATVSFFPGSDLPQLSQASGSE